MKKKALIIIASALLAVFAFALFGCDRFDTSTPDFSDIYRNYTATQAEIDSSELSVVLPDGWSVLAQKSGAHADSDIGYIASMNAFIVVNKAGDLSVAVVPEGEDKHISEEDLLISPGVGVKAIKAVGDYFAVRIDSSTGFVGVMDRQGNWRVNAAKTRSAGVEIGSATLTDAIRILDGELVAVASTHVADPLFTGGRNRAAIYRISTGELVGSVRTEDGGLNGVYGFDGKYLSVEISSSSAGSETYIYTVPASLQGSDILTCPNLGSFTNRADHDDFYTESLYLGGGKFYVHTEWTVSSSDAYTYSYDGEYYRAERYFYFPDDEDREQYSSAHIFLNCVSSRYDYATDRTLDGTVVAPSSFLKDGYIYSSFGLLVNSKKEAQYDQFILDEDLNIVYSLTTNFGISPEGAQERDEVSIYDLMMQGSDGYYYSRVYPSAVRVYNAEGDLVMEKKGREFVSATLQNGILIAGVSSGSKTVYGAYDINTGEEVIPFEYSSILPFRSFYTYAVKSDGKKAVLLGRDGKEAPLAEGATSHFEDIAKSSSGEAVVQRGCYVYGVKKDDVTVFGVKNMSGDYGNDVVIEAALSSATLYSPSTDNSLVFLWGADADGDYCVYSLFSSRDTAADTAPEGLPDWAVGLIAAGCTLVAAAVIFGVVKAVKVRKKGGENA